MIHEAVLQAADLRTFDAAVVATFVRLATARQRLRERPLPDRLLQRALRTGDG
jgi:hypothetical protein